MLGHTSKILKEKPTMNQTELEQAALDFVGQPNYKPAKPRMIAKRLGLDEDGAQNLKRAIRTLVKRNQLRFGEEHFVLPASLSAKQQKHSTKQQPPPKFAKPAASV